MSLILVVDDQAIIREPIAASLGGAGYRTACAADGTQALAAIERERPDLVLLDVTMPGMDGLTFLAAMRALPHFARIPVILLTAASDPARVVDTARLGVQDVIPKTAFTGAGLLERVVRYCRATRPADDAVADEL